jgi:hypothetical protein
MGRGGRGESEVGEKGRVAKNRHARRSFGVEVT